MGGLAGLAIGGLGVAAAQRRYPAFRSLTIPFRAFLVVSSGTFAGEFCWLLAHDPFARLTPISHHCSRSLLA